MAISARKINSGADSRRDGIVTVKDDGKGPFLITERPGIHFRSGHCGSIQRDGPVSSGAVIGTPYKPAPGSIAGDGQVLIVRIPQKCIGPAIHGQGLIPGRIGADRRARCSECNRRKSDRRQRNGRTIEFPIDNLAGRSCFVATIQMSGAVIDQEMIGVITLIIISECNIDCSRQGVVSHDGNSPVILVRIRVEIILP